MPANQVQSTEYGNIATVINVLTSLKATLQNSKSAFDASSNPESSARINSLLADVQAQIDTWTAYKTGYGEALSQS